MLMVFPIVSESLIKLKIIPLVRINWYRCSFMLFCILSNGLDLNLTQTGWKSKCKFVWDPAGYIKIIIDIIILFPFFYMEKIKILKSIINLIQE